MIISEMNIDARNARVTGKMFLCSCERRRLVLTEKRLEPGAVRFMVDVLCASRGAA
jgi:hypothetical protein